MSNTDIPILEKIYLPKDAEILNAIIEEADVCLYSGYCNSVTLNLRIKAEGDLHGEFISIYSYTRDIGSVVKGIFETIGGFEPDASTPFSKLKGRVIRVVCSGNKFIGIGNFMEDKWFLESSVEEFVKERTRRGEEMR